MAKDDPFGGFNDDIPFGAQAEDPMAYINRQEAQPVEARPMQQANTSQRSFSLPKLNSKTARVLFQIVAVVGFLIIRAIGN